MEHEGRVVFEDAEDMARRIDDEALDVTAQDILVLKRIGPTGAPACPRPATCRSPGSWRGPASGHGAHLRRPHERHGGRHHRAARHARGRHRRRWHVQNGDRIRLSVARREIALLVDDAELARRMAAAPVTRPTAERGYRKLFMQTVTQADQGGFRLPARRRHPRHRAQAVAAGPRQPAASAKITARITVRASQPEPHSPNPQPDRRP